MLVPLLFVLRLKTSVPPLAWVGLFAAGMALPLWRRAKSNLPGTIQVHLSADGCAQIDDAAAANTTPTTMTPWDCVSKVKLHALDGGRWRLRAVPAGPWWVPKPDPVDAEVRLTTGQAEELNRRIGEWRRPAPRGPVISVQ
jgi:hypothetical protein